jgi:hypothetical protein
VPLSQRREREQHLAWVPLSQRREWEQQLAWVPLSQRREREQQLAWVPLSQRREQEQQPWQEERRTALRYSPESFEALTPGALELVYLFRQP